MLVCVQVAHAETRLRIVRHGKDVVAPKGSFLVTNVVALAESASVHSTSYAVKTNTWQEILGSDSFVLVSFEPAARLRLEAPSNQGHEEIVVKEILVRLPEGREPDHIFIKSVTGTLAVTKYTPKALKRIVLDPLIGIVLSHPYFQNRDDLD